MTDPTEALRHHHPQEGPRMIAPLARPGTDLRLVSSGDGWAGTFAILVRTAVDDILSDGAPFAAFVMWETDDGSMEGRDVEIAALDAGAGTITTSDQCVIPVDAIRVLDA